MQQRFISEKNKFIVGIILAAIVLMLIFTGVLWFKVKTSYETITCSFFALMVIFLFVWMLIGTFYQIKKINDVEYKAYLFNFLYITPLKLNKTDA